MPRRTSSKCRCRVGGSCSRRPCRISSAASTALARLAWPASSLRRAKARRLAVMRPMRSTSSLMVARLVLAVSSLPRWRKRTVLPDSVRSAASGWLSSWAMLVDICPITASLPAWTSSSWALRRVSSACWRSWISAVRRALLACRSAVRSAIFTSSSPLARCSASRAARRVASTLRRSFQAISRNARRAKPMAASMPLRTASRRRSSSGLSRVRFHGVSFSARVCAR